MDVVQMETDHPKQFDDSPLDRIPTSWEVTNLGNSFDELYRYPTYYGIEYVESGIPEVRGELIKADGNIDENAGKFRYISKETANRFQRVRLEPGDFVMTVRGTMGKIAMVPERLRGAVITANLIRMKFTKSMVVPEWARHFLRSEFFQDALDLATSATTIKTIQVPELCAIAFWRPPTKEQHRIAEILDIIDEAIQKTEALISKLKAMKQGLLHDLLTRGLDKNGKLRDPKAHPEQFKDSPLGMIPIEWETLSVKDFASVKGGKRLPRGHLYSESPTEYRYLRVLDFFERDVEYNSLQYLKEGTFEILKPYEIQKRDIFISIAGSIGYAGAFFPQIEDRVILTENAARLVIDDKFQGKYLAFQLNSEIVQDQILKEIGTGGGVPKLALHRIENLKVIGPSSNEQNRILDILERCDMRIRKENKYRDKLKLQKKGLMHDLLTGKVRVKV